jgi:hypothetical protein
MEVSFTKVDDKRHSVSITRELGPPLVPRFGPGYDDLMPHDVAHYLVEEHFGIELGVWGQLAAGGGGIFTPAPQDNTLRYQRRAQRIGAVGRADMQRSERLVVITVATWERSVGRVKHEQSLGRGRSLAFAWPRRLTFDGSGSHRGRRTPKATPRPVRR